jgi:DnaK suppressor protein
MEHLDKAKAALEQNLKTVIAELSTIGIYNDETGDWEVRPETEAGSEADENSHADASEDLDTRSATLSTLEQEFRNTKRALQKIADGSYGKCEVCQSEIAPERLAFKPDARTCSPHMDEESTLPL